MNNYTSLHIQEYSTILNVEHLLSKLKKSEYSTCLNIEDDSNYLIVGSESNIINIDIKCFNAKWVGFKILLDFLERSGVADIFNIGIQHYYIDKNVPYLDIVSRSGYVADIFYY